MNPEQYFEGTALELARAIQQNRLDDVEQLARRVELNRFYKADMTPLIWAMLVDQEAAFLLLLKTGANPNLKDHDNIQPVALAAGAREDNKYLKLLLQHGGDPNSTQRSEPALHVAYDFDYYKNVLLLLDAGADINARDRDGNTILISAGYQDEFDRAIDLINRGADINAQSAGGGIAFDVQESTPRAGSKAYQGQVQLKKLLVERGVKFPVPQPSKQPYAALQERWYQTPDGQQWQQKIQQVANDPLGFGDVWRKVDDAAFAAFKTWMKANDIPEPARPQPKFIDPNE
ncbi:ankyrin repeat domain-containing protein [Fibrella forsythiae]|uniref:Ankyrin repeat domain-containing protein n=1 Tax=Fibrella forsythiae TaxID=2817061 RepID=A0ABS3JQB7_9BACT|nr:ankyrin repeat domain-containing protein [Fibrella forsythiae]MBO0952200.1 ankyrin repeat domain-containing protein [Fibrella forsythiae]